MATAECCKFAGILSAELSQHHLLGFEIVQLFHHLIENTLFYNTRDDSTHGQHQIVNTKIRLFIFFAAKDGESLYNGIPSPPLALFVVMLP